MSPAFGVLLKQALDEAGQPAVVETGGFGREGEPAHNIINETLAGIGLSLSSHRSRRVKGLNLGEFDGVCSIDPTSPPS